MHFSRSEFGSGIHFWHFHIDYSPESQLFGWFLRKISDENFRILPDISWFLLKKFMKISGKCIRSLKLSGNHLLVGTSHCESYSNIAVLFGHSHDLFFWTKVHFGLLYICLHQNMYQLFEESLDIFKKWSVFAEIFSRASWMAKETPPKGACTQLFGLVLSWSLFNIFRIAARPSRFCFKTTFVH